MNVRAMAGHRSAFASEEGLVTTFLAQLEGGKSPWVPRSFIREFDYASGRTDILSLAWNDEVIAFEAKLNNWRKALHQAWRNTSFANRVYVVLPRDRASVISYHRAEFEEWGVGLCLVTSDGIEIAIESAVVEPVMPWLHNKAKETLTTHGCGSHSGVCTTDM